MHPIRTIACLGVLTLAAACSPSGYYDSQGYYHTYDSGPHSENVPGGSGNTTIIERDRPDYQTRTRSTSENIIYSHEGFYDRNGYFITMENGPAVPGNMIPARGMCRVWISDRDPSYQPPVENCNGIETRLPPNAYILYGG